MNSTVREHLMAVLVDAKVPQSLLSELMQERRGLRDSIIQAALPVAMQTVLARGGESNTWVAEASSIAARVADTVLAQRDAPRVAPRPITVDPHALEHARQMHAVRLVVCEGLRAVKSMVLADPDAMDKLLAFEQTAAQWSMSKVGQAARVDPDEVAK